MIEEEDIDPRTFYVSVGVLADLLNVTVQKIRGAAREMGVKVDDHRNCTPFYNAVNCAKIIRRLAQSEGAIDFPGHPVLLAEIQRQQAESKTRCDA